MRRPAIAVLVALGLCAATSCTGDTKDSSPSTLPSVSESPTASSSPAGPAPLPTGKDDLELDSGSYLTTDGFSPALRFVVPPGWTSVHRGVDGFDLGMPDPEKDAPLVAVVFLTPSEPSATGALAALRDRTDATVRATSGRIGSIRAVGLDIVGGHGELVASAEGGIALDAAPGQRVRVLAADVAGTPLLVVVLVPDATRWVAALRLARGMLDGTRPL